MAWSSLFGRGHAALLRGCVSRRLRLQGVLVDTQDDVCRRQHFVDNSVDNFTWQKNPWCRSEGPEQSPLTECPGRKEGGRSHF